MTPRKIPRRTKCSWLNIRCVALGQTQMVYIAGELQRIKMGTAHDMTHMCNR